MLGGSGTQEDTKFHREVLTYNLVVWEPLSFALLSQTFSSNHPQTLRESGGTAYVCNSDFIKFLITTHGSQKKKGLAGYAARWEIQLM